MRNLIFRVIEIFVYIYAFVRIICSLCHLILNRIILNANNELLQFFRASSTHCVTAHR